MTTAVIGDIHGNLRALRILISKLRPLWDAETSVVFLGDYIDRGPDSRGVVDELLTMRKEHPGAVHFLKGNHEQLLERSLQDQTKHTWIISMDGLTTVKSYSPALEREFRDAMRQKGQSLIEGRATLPYDRLRREMPEDHLSFLGGLDLYYEDDECLCTHAGVSRNFVSPDREDERSLLWGDQDFPGYYTGSKLIVYGHYSKKARLVDGFPQPMTTRNSVCLDTSRHGVLSALLLPERRIVQSGDASDEACGAPPRTKMIVVLDDKDHALKQVLFELPEEVDRNELVFRHFDTVESFRRADIERPFIVFLDFFLSKDRVFGSDVIPELSCEHLVCFSSKREMSDHMRKLAGQRDRGRIGHVYSVRKLKEVIENAELGEVLRTIFAE